MDLDFFAYYVRNWMNFMELIQIKVKCAEQQVLH